MSTTNNHQKNTSNSVDHLKNKNNCNFYTSSLNITNYLCKEINDQIVDILERKEKTSNESKEIKEIKTSKTSKSYKSYKLTGSNTYKNKKSIFYLSYIKSKAQKISQKTKHALLYEIVSMILRLRVDACLKIQRFTRFRNRIIKVKTYFIIRKIVLARLKCVQKIQKTVRMYLCKKSVYCILNLKKNNWGIFYYPESEVKTVKINLDLDYKFQAIKLNYNRILKCFYFFLKKHDYFKKFYKFNFIINNKALIDMNFENIIFPNGKIYNILDLELIRSKGYLTNFYEVKQELKFCQPVRTVTTPDIRPNRSVQLFKTNNTKSILKKNSFDDFTIKKRKVSFNLASQYCE
jgi:hypothetical protein